MFNINMSHEHASISDADARCVDEDINEYLHYDFRGIPHPQSQHQRDAPPSLAASISSTPSDQL
jgi:hypothetical protein